jgi:hypothetical protein
MKKDNVFVLIINNNLQGCFINAAVLKEYIIDYLYWEIKGDDYGKPDDNELKDLLAAKEYVKDLDFTTMGIGSSRFFFGIDVKCTELHI